jgi:hypothetical protein
MAPIPRCGAATAGGVSEGRYFKGKRVLEML